MPRRRHHGIQDVIDAVQIEYGLTETGNPAVPYQTTDVVRPPRDRHIVVPTGNGVWLPTALNNFCHAGRAVTSEAQFREASAVFATALRGELIDGGGLRELSTADSPKYMREAALNKIYLVWPVRPQPTGRPNMAAFNRANGRPLVAPQQQHSRLTAPNHDSEAVQGHMALFEPRVASPVEPGGQVLPPPTPVAEFAALRQSTPSAAHGRPGAPATASGQNPNRPTTERDPMKASTILRTPTPERKRR